METNINLKELLRISRLDRRHFIQCFGDDYFYKSLLFNNPTKKRIYNKSIDKLLILLKLFKIAINREELEIILKNK